MPLIFKILVPVLLGAAIGYFTNDLAIRMLFRPRRPVFIGKWQLPFTPGIIPRNQGRIAGAVAAAVSGQLFTAGDLVEQIKNSAAKEEITARLTDAVFGPGVTIRSLTAFAVLPAPDEEPTAELPDPPQPPVGEPVGQPVDESAPSDPPTPVTEEDAAEEAGPVEEAASEESEEPAVPVRTGAAEKIGAYIADLAVKKLNGSDLRTVIDDMVWEGIQEYRKNPLIALFLTESVLDAVCEKVENALRGYMKDKGRDMLCELVTNEARGMADKPLGELADDIGLKRERVEDVLNRTLDRFAEEFGASFCEKTDIAGTVRRKIEEMDPAQLEELVMSVMKRELQAVINLGALLGAVIGAVNIFL